MTRVRALRELADVVRSMPETVSARPDAIERRDSLGGLIHEYRARAA